MVWQPEHGPQFAQQFAQKGTKERCLKPCPLRLGSNGFQLVEVYSPSLSAASTVTDASSQMEL